MNAALKQAQHTPTPWQLRGKKADIGTDAYCVASDWGGKNWQADAAHIVRCVNSHNELLVALMFLTDSASLVSGQSSMGHLLTADLVRARAALAKVSA